MEKVHVGKPGGSAHETPTERLGKALQKLESASALISQLINDELAGSKNRDRLECLYSVKGCVTCAIEETRMRLTIDAC